MSDILAKFGVDAAVVASLPEQATRYPKQVAGRVAHIDADFMAYQVSAETKAELDPDDPTPRKTYEDMLHNAKEAVDHIRRMAGAVSAVLHTTHNSDKGGREKQAILKPYQANRADRDNRPEQLDRVREFLGSGVGDTTGTFVGMNHTNQEADDGMAQAAYADPDNNIVCSMDKDLLMVPGIKLNMYTGKVYKCDDSFGSLWIDEKTSATTGKVTKKVTGMGTKFFWCQMLMGDPADNISGVPSAPGVIWQEYDGTKAYKDLYNQWIAAEDGEKADKIQERLNKLTAKPKLCGQMLAYRILETARNDTDCYKTVRDCYVKLAEDHGHVYKHWKTGEVVTPTQAMLSEMKLLWMRRKPDENDVLNWLKEVLK